jgi:dienelactone hydrolase
VTQTLPRWLCCLLFGVAIPVCAQSEYSMRGGDRAPDLVLPTEPSDIATVAAPRLALYKPAGNGPFPALVLLHQCGGLGRPDGSWQNLSMLEWAREALGRGYVVLQLDSLNPRDVRSVCQGPQKDVFQSRGMRDALLAAAHLRKLPYVDPRRVAFAGWSWGAGNGLMVASAKSVAAVGVDQRFQAVAAHYPPCVNYPKNGQPPYTLVLSEVDTPLLVLLGGKDNETPPQECTERLAPLKDAGAPVEWHLYPEAAHCWDCKNLHGRKKTDIRGNTVEYLYDEAVTKDSARRMFEFFDKAFAARK